MEKYDQISQNPLKFMYSGSVLNFVLNGGRYLMLLKKYFTVNIPLSSIDLLNILLTAAKKCITIRWFISGLKVTLNLYIC